MDFAAGASVTGDITLARPLSEGAMGRVWVAHHAKLNREVAVKFMAQKLSRDRAMLARFNREAEAAATINNPHVVQILEHGTAADGTPFIAMELLTGETLGERLSFENRLGLDTTAAILRQVGSALDAAHARGIVHRDIKPDNLFLARGGVEPMVKVLDFGMAKRMRKRSQSIVTATGVAVGTPEYMSPEQVLGAKDVDFKSDLWALAVVAYNMVTGEAAFEAATPHALFFTICKGSFTALDRHGAPTELAPWFKRAFQPGKEKRFGSAREMVLRFEAAVAEAKAAGYDDDDATQALAPTNKLKALERFGAPPAPESQTNPRYARPSGSEDHLAATLDFRANEIADPDSDEDGIPTMMSNDRETADAIKQALANLGNPMGEERAPDSQTTLRSLEPNAAAEIPEDTARFRRATVGDKSVSGYNQTVNSQRNPFDELVGELEDPPDSESVPGVAKPRVPLSSDAPIDYGDPDASGPRASLAPHSPDSSGARVSVSARRAEMLAGGADPSSEATPAQLVARPVRDERKKSTYLMLGAVAVVAAIVIFVVASGSPTPSGDATQAANHAAGPALAEETSDGASPRNEQPPPTDDVAAAAAPTAEASAVLEDGTLTITCVPQCINVRVGERMLGPTPLFKQTMPAGTHRLTLVRQGVSPSVVEVEVAAGQHVSRSFNLTTGRAAGTSSPLAATETPKPAPGAPAPTEAAAPTDTPQVVDDPYEDDSLPIAPGERAPPPLPVKQ